MTETPELESFRNRLQHFRLAGSTYFVTWRLHPDQTPLALIERTLVASAIKHFNGDRYFLSAYVVMDDHVHVIARPGNKNCLSDILHSWKSFTANQLQRKHGRTGSIWQKDTFERIIRDEDELIVKIEYILNNPQQRWPDQTKYQWVEWFHDQI